MENNNLKNTSWKKYLFPDIFIIKKGFYNKKPENLYNKSDIPFLGATAYNNGITSFLNIRDIEESSKVGHGKNEPLSKKIFDGNSIAVTNNGSVGHGFYQSKKFTCSHDINPLYLKNKKLNKFLGLFLVTSIEQQKVCFEYARKWRPKRMIKSHILIPSKDNKPDFSFMEEYANNVYLQKEEVYIKYIKKRLNELKHTNKPLELEEKKWKEFLLSEVVTIESGRDIYENERLEGNIPYVSATANNNGIGYFVGNKNSTLEKNCLSVNRNGSVGYSFYHPYLALFSNDCRKLRLKKGDKYVGLFLSNQITLQKNKYGYGYKMGTARLKKQKIMLPINEFDNPDFEYMKEYMKYIELSKLTDYLKYKKIINNL